MKLQQLRFLAAVVQNDLNLTAAANKLATTQPAVSKQLKLLEDELGFRIFTRKGRSFTDVTPPGERIVKYALRALQEVHNIKGVSEEFKHENRGSLSIGTTHTQARYVLPAVIKQFCDRHPEVKFHLHQGTSEQIAEMGMQGRIDFAVATGAQELFSDYVLLPCYQWRRKVIVPKNHPLAAVRKLTLEELSRYPLVTYVFSYSGPSSLHAAFARAGVEPTFALTARDSDVIKTYVRLGLGVGIIAGMALEPKDLKDLHVIDSEDLFPTHTTWAGVPRNGLLRHYMYDFLQLLAPHLSRRLIDRAITCESQQGVETLFKDVELASR